MAGVAVLARRRRDVVRRLRRALRPEGAVRRTGALALCAFAAAAAGCSGGDVTGPEAHVAGSYAATEWTITSVVADYDVLALGGHLTLVLHADSTTDGEFYIPAGAAPEPQEQRVSMAGRWSLEGGVVRFTMDGDTYVRFVDWEVGDRTLSTEFMNGGWTVRTVLRR